MDTYRVGFFIGSLSSTSINRVLARALIRVAPADLEFVELPIGDLPLYSPDHDDDYPPAPRALKRTLAAMDGVLFVTPEYNRSIPGPLKNAIDWASRPFGQNSFDKMPVGMIGASPSSIGTALAQRTLRVVMAYCNAYTMSQPEAYITFSPAVFGPEGEVSDDSVRGFLEDYMREFREHVARISAAAPRPQGTEDHTV